MSEAMDQATAPALKQALVRLWSNARRVALAVRDFIVIPVPADLRGPMVLAQASDLARLSLGVAVLFWCVVGPLYGEYFKRPGFVVNSLIAGAIFISTVMMFGHSYAWLRRTPRKTAAQANEFLRHMGWTYFALATGLGAYIIDLMEVAAVPQVPIIYGFAAGCFMVPLLVFPPATALSFWGCLTLCSLTSFSFSPYRDGWISCVFFSFILVTLYSCIRSNRRLAQRTINHLRLRENAELIKLLLRDFEESASDWLWETGPDSALRNVSARFAQVAGKTQAEMNGRSPHTLFGNTGLGSLRPDTEIFKLMQAMAVQDSFRNMVMPISVAGETRYWSLSGKPAFDRLGNFTGYRGVGSDITADRRHQDQVTYHSRHDPLTRLPNRMLLTQTLGQCSLVVNETPFGLIYLDLDGFKLVNDTHGHATGDAVLITAADRIRACLQEGDMPARLGGDEFAVIRTGDDPAAFAAFAQELIKTLSAPYSAGGQPVRIGVSAGITLAPRDTTDPGALLLNAELALSRAKAGGRGQASFYDAAMDEQLQRKRVLQSDLSLALERGEFRLDFQPLMDIASGQIAGAEALLRWQHPTRGLMPPGDFIPLIEESGLVGPVGAWVIEHACTVAAAWPAPLIIAVNLSPLQFRDPDLAASILDVLTRTGLSPDRLELEITESSVLESDTQTAATINTLHEAGLRIALDDFGTGYSSLSYLQRYPFNKIKIDRAFIRRLGAEKGDTSIVLAILGLAERLDMIVTAEGVETAAQADLLLSYGCQQAQGFLFHRPMAAAALAAILDAETAANTEAAA
jgi:diguanylate cyclase (GGDEF)-like protein